jgi:isoleucyl-tRNA synthetase
VSLIRGVAWRNAAPYRQVLTHGFVVDGEGRKMSKSLGNVVAPQDVMSRFGADILRLWVASADYQEDVRISEGILTQVAESYRKIRNTFRYLLANLYDFEPSRRADPSAYTALDRWAAHRTRQVVTGVQAAYEASQFHEVVRQIYQFCVVDLSAFYLDAIKDRLYTDAADGQRRRCAQTVLYDILNSLVRLTAPVLALTSDEVWQLMRAAGWVHEPSVHLAAWPVLPAAVLNGEEERHWSVFLSMRDIVMKAIEEQRASGVIGSPLEAQITLSVKDQALGRLCEQHRDTLAEAFVVSSVQVQVNNAPEADTGVPGLLAVQVRQAPGKKCERCWKHLPSVGSVAAHPQLCDRCAAVVAAHKPVVTGKGPQ